jgi:hypothetical protein
MVQFNIANIVFVELQPIRQIQAEQEKIVSFNQAINKFNTISQKMDKGKLFITFLIKKNQ